MTLQEYLDKYNILLKDLAKICNLSTGVFYKILNGESISKKTANIIFKKTRGILDLRKKDD